MNDSTVTSLIKGLGVTFEMSRSQLAEGVRNNSIPTQNDPSSNLCTGFIEEALLLRGSPQRNRVGEIAAAQ